MEFWQGLQTWSFCFCCALRRGEGKTEKEGRRGERVPGPDELHEWERGSPGRGGGQGGRGWHPGVSWVVREAPRLRAWGLVVNKSDEIDESGVACVYRGTVVDGLH